MSIKLFGVGNVLLGDDGIGVEIAKRIKLHEKIRVYLGEIFVEDCLLDIEADDTVIIIDAVDLGWEVGEVQVLPLEDCRKYLTKHAFCHDASLLYSLVYGHIPIQNAWLIGVQIAQIDYMDSLSAVLMQKLDQIVDRIDEEVASICTKSP